VESPVLFPEAVMLTVTQPGTLKVFETELATLFFDKADSELLAVANEAPLLKVQLN
jgi:hypothetical protein